MNISFRNIFKNNYTSFKDFCKMEPEYAVKISLTKHKHDNPQRPYYWSLVKCEEFWYQIDAGWEESSQDCFKAALEYYHKLSFFKDV